MTILGGGEYFETVVYLAKVYLWGLALMAIVVSGSAEDYILHFLI